MGMPAVSSPLRWTPAMVRELPDDGNRYECVDGELLVTPSPAAPHQWIVIAVLKLLARYTEETGLGLTFTAPLDVEFHDKALAQPDIFVMRQPADPASPLEVRDLLLVIEVLSPTTARRDRGIKRELYMRTGVREYWIVDPDSRGVMRWQPGTATARWEEGTMVWSPDGAARPFTLDLPALFGAMPDLPERLRFGAPDGSD
jgi:Uma2 family endonuclease